MYLFCVQAFKEPAHADPIRRFGGELDASPKGRDAVSLKAMLQFLRDHGMDQFVDAYGIHFYPQGNASPAARLSSLQRDVAECGSGDGGEKPCWLTEWGLPVHSGKSCPVNEDNRIEFFPN
jgi:hypothetical protein